MHTSVVWLALAGLAPQAEATPTWRNDYFQARQKGAAQKKPLAVFLAPGQGGWKKLSAEGGLGDGAKKVLADRYVCVHIDTTTEQGRKLAKDFEIDGGVGLVISDRTGKFQAFRHEGTLPGADLRAYLERYADPDRVATTTETHTSSRTSSYPSTSGTYAPAFQGWSQPSYGYVPSFSRGGGGGC